MTLVPNTPIHIKIYEAPDGTYPFEERFQSIRDLKTMAMIHTHIARLRLGNFGNHKALGGGVSELKFDTGPGVRIYYGKKNNALVILLVGGTKKSQTYDIKQAKIYWKEYKESSKNA